MDGLKRKISKVHDCKSSKLVYEYKLLSVCLHLSVLVLWTLFDLCTCWALDSSSWVHRKFMTLHMHTCDNRSLSAILSCHHHLRLLSLILLLFLVTMTGLPSNSFSAAHTLAPSVFFSFCCSVFFFVLLHSASHVVTQQLLPCLSSNSQWVTPFLSLSFFFFSTGNGELHKRGSFNCTLFHYVTWVKAKVFEYQLF